MGNEENKDKYKVKGDNSRIYSEEEIKNVLEKVDMEEGKAVVANLLGIFNKNEEAKSRREKRVAVLTKGNVLSIVERSLEILVDKKYVYKIKYDAVWVLSGDTPSLEILFAVKINNERFISNEQDVKNWVSIKGIVDPSEEIFLIEKNINNYVTELLRKARPCLFDDKIKVYTPMAIYGNGIGSAIPGSDLKIE